MAQIKPSSEWMICQLFSVAPDAEFRKTLDAQFGSNRPKLLFFTVTSRVENGFDALDRAFSPWN